MIKCEYLVLDDTTHIQSCLLLLLVLCRPVGPLVVVFGHESNRLLILFYRQYGLQLNSGKLASICRVDMSNNSTLCIGYGWVDLLKKCVGLESEN